MLLENLTMAVGIITLLLAARREILEEKFEREFEQELDEREYKSTRPIN